MKKVAAIYAVSLAIFIGVLFAVLRAGGSSAEPLTGSGRPLYVRLLDGLQDPVSQVLLQVVLIVVVARLIGTLFTKFGQPSVVGEMFAGIALGPSLLGSLAPGFSGFVFPASSLANLSTLSQFGILLFMFGVGMELDSDGLKEKARSAILVSHLSILVPFALGSTAALSLYGTYRGQSTSFVAFALFMGISMSITAFPVLARVLQERGLMQSPMGTIALTSAAVDDVTAWCALAIIVALARAHNPANAGWTVLLALTFVGFAFVIAKPLLEKIAGQNPDREPSSKAVVAALLCAFVFALTTQVIGVHAFFGAFIAGVILPKSAIFRRILHERLYLLASLVLVPIFFAFTGLRTELGLLRSAQDWGTCGMIFSLAIIGKLGAGTIASRLTGLSWRESLGVGALMNTRGLVELIALNVGLDLGVLSPKIFTMLVIMALATTFMTGPILALLKLGNACEERYPEQAEAAASVA